ncbi:MAG: DUF938 domain-containing protein [Cyanobacteria bacterium J06598_3]
MTHPSKHDFRQYAPATERNRLPILEVLQRVLPHGTKPSSTTPSIHHQGGLNPSGTVLEIASGTGEHITFFASQLTHLQWIATEPQALGRKSIQAWVEALSVENVRLPPLSLDVSCEPWPVEVNFPLVAPITAIININMIHISPWAMCTHLMAGAQRILPTGGVLYLYGPFQRDGIAFAPSNEAFDRMLRDRDSRWGIRNLAAVQAIAQQHSLQLTEVIEMPANNLSVVFTRQ